jgi:hypothetical protein
MKNENERRSECRAGRNPSINEKGMEKIGEGGDMKRMCKYEECLKDYRR